MKGDTSSYSLDAIKEKVRANQEVVLDEFSDVDDAESGFNLKYRFDVLNGFTGTINSQGLEILSKNKLVASVFKDKILYDFLTRSVPLINADDVWVQQTNSGSITGTGQTVCVMDSGIDYTHPDLGGCFGVGCKVKGGWDFVNNDNDPIDDWGHGTNVAGSVAANGLLKGAAPNADLIAVKVSSNGFATSSAIVAGLDYCISNINTLGTDAITMSIGSNQVYSSTCSTSSPIVSSFFPAYRATNLNIPITIASGNGAHNDGISWPACAENVISVGATYIGYPIVAAGYGICNDPHVVIDDITCYSNTWVNLDVVAPGSSWINTTGLNGAYTQTDGTSIATPHVVGTIALIQQVYPSITPFQAEELLKQTGVPVTDPDNMLTFPRIDALQAVNRFSSWGNDMRLTFDSGSSVVPSIDVDGANNIHIVWEDTQNGILGIYYTKLDENGNTLVNDLRLTNVGASFPAAPSMGVDSLGNVNIVWQDVRDGNQEIYYTKLDNNGNTLVDDLRLTFDNANSVYPSIATDSQGRIYIAWEDWRNNGNPEIYYTKLDSNGNTLVDDLRLTTAPGLSVGPSINVDGTDKVYIAWQDRRDAGVGETYYTKLSNNGNTLVDDTRVTSSDGIESVGPSIFTDSQGIIHLTWIDNRDGNLEIYYKDFSQNNNVRVTQPSSLSFVRQSNSLISFRIYSPLNLNQRYMFVLSMSGDSPGINFRNHHIPLNSDFLFASSLSNPSSVGLSNSFGSLSMSGTVNGVATVSLNIPNMQGLSGQRIYAVAVIYDSQGQVTGITNSVPVDII